MPQREEASVRQQYIFPASLAQTVEQLADKQGLTKSEFVRRAIEAYDPDVEAIGEEELSAILGQLTSVVQETISRVDKSLADIRASRARREAERDQVRAETSRWAEEHPGEMAAIIQAFTGGER